MLTNYLMKQCVYRNLTKQQAKSSAMMVAPLKARMFGAFVNHRDTADNLEESPFEFTEDSYEKVKMHIAKFPDNYKHSAVIPVLFIA